MRKIGPKQTLFSGILFPLKTGSHAKCLILIIPKMLVENRKLIAKKEKNRKPQDTHTKNPAGFQIFSCENQGEKLFPKWPNPKKTLLMILGETALFAG